MMIVADSGSTKAEWSLLASTGNIRVRTQGISPYFLNSAAIVDLLRKELLPYLPPGEQITAIYYYGTGCTAPPMIRIVHDALRELFHIAEIHVHYDLVAAAHALCGKEKGVVCILGTGSNSGYYNGAVIEKNIPGLGFILGDEGSGAYLGKLLCSTYLYSRLGPQLTSLFSDTFQVNKDSLLEKIYSSPMPNRLLASYAVFLSEHRADPAIKKIIDTGLGDFFRIHLSHYGESTLYPIHFSGSVAWYFSEEIMRLCDVYGYACGRIIKEPMEGLINFHAQNL